MCAVPGLRGGFSAPGHADAGRLMSINMTSGRRRVLYRRRDAVHRTQQTDIGTASDEIFDQHQIGRVVLDIKHGMRLCVGLNLRLAAGGAWLHQWHVVVQQSGSVRSRTCCRHRPCLPRRFRLPSIRPAACSHQADAGAFLNAGFFAETVERLEKLCQFFRRQSFAGVLDADAHASGSARDAVHDDRSARLVVFDALESRLIRICFTVSGRL